MGASQTPITCVKRVESAIIVLKREGEKERKEGEGKKDEGNNGKRV
jgi:hypothetical protein